MVRRVTATDGSAIGYTELGAGPPLVCIPGGPGLSADHLGNLGGLDRSFHLIFVHTRGTSGLPAPIDPSGYSLASYASDVDEVRRALRLDQILLFGHSHGALVAAHYATRHPSAVSLVILDGVPGPSKKVPSDISDYFVDWAGIGEPYITPHLRNLHQPAADWFFENEWPAVNVLGEIAGIAAPTLVIAGAEDQIAVGEADAIVAALAHGHLIVVPEAGHFAWVENPNAYLEAVETFVTRTLLPPTS